MKKVRTVIVDPSEISADGIAGAFAGSEFEVVGRETGHAGCGKYEDVELAVVCEHGSLWRETYADVREKLPGARVVVVASTYDLPTVRAAIVAGVSAVASHRDGARKLLAVSRLAMSGGVSMPEATVMQCVKEGSSGELLRAEAQKVLDGMPRKALLLTVMQMRVVILISRGIAVPEIAVRLEVSEATVKVHLSRAYQRIGVKSRVQLLLWGRRNGFDKLDPDDAIKSLAEHSGMTQRRG